MNCRGIKAFSARSRCVIFLFHGVSSTHSHLSYSRRSSSSNRVFFESSLHAYPINSATCLITFCKFETGRHLESCNSGNYRQHASLRDIFSICSKKVSLRASPTLLLQNLCILGSWTAYVHKTQVKQWFVLKTTSRRRFLSRCTLSIRKTFLGAQIHVSSKHALLRLPFRWVSFSGGLRIHDPVRGAVLKHRS